MGRPPIYPWDEWLDGSEHILVWGFDFHIDVRTMRKVARGEASRRGVAISTRVRGVTLTIGPQDHGFATVDDPVTEMAPDEGE